jgi:ribosomal protein S18 acetylase RimI-like enzyme
MEQPTVRRATRDDVPQLAAVLARAFARDPYFAWLAGAAPERNQRMRDAWHGILRFASAGMAETWTDADRSGVAIWIPPGRKSSSLIDSFRILPSFARLTGWNRMREASAAVELLEQRRHVHVPRPHFYLSALGVDPGLQGRGIGSAILQPVLRQADATEAVAYLETATARNVLLYERHGFAVVEELLLPGTDIRGWLMRRPPRPIGIGADRVDPGSPGRSDPG